MKKKLFLMLGMSAMLLTSCSNEEELVTPSSQKQLQVRATVDGQTQSRVTENLWDAGDAIGITSDGLMTNAQYTTTGDGTFVSDASVFFTDAATHTFTAYYPYKTGSNTYITFNPSKDATPSGQKANDYMFATATASTSDPCLKLNFQRKMTRVILNVKTSTDYGFQADDVFGDANGSWITSSSGALDGLMAMTSFNKLTGAVTHPLTTKYTYSMTASTDDRDNHVRQYMIIIAPQTACSYKHTFNSGEDTATSYSVNLGDIEWEAGYSYTYNITIKGATMSVASESIDEWKDGLTKDCEN